MSDNFNEYGHDFQIKALSCIFGDKYFLSQVIDALFPDYFEGDSKQWLAKVIVDYYQKFKDCPSKDVIRVEIGNLSDDDFKRQVKMLMVDVWKSLDSKDLEYIKEKIIDFCKNQEMKKAIISSVDLLKTGNYGLIREKIESAMNVGLDTNLGHDYQADFEDRYAEEAHIPVHTPWDALNDITKGGPGAGHLCLVMAPPGVGKSWILASMGASALKQGKTVLHYTLELSDFYVGKRYDCILSGMHIDKLDDNKEEVLSKVNAANKGQLIVRRYFSRGVSVMGLRAHIDKCIRLGVKPDMVIVDYADLMRLSGNGDLRHQIENLYEELRAIAGEQGIPVWTASQTNRTGAGEDFIDGDVAAEAYSKNNTPDLIVSFSRPERVRSRNIAYAFVVKNRLGPDKRKLVGKMDTDYGHTEFYADDSPEAREVLTSVPTQQDVENQQIAGLQSSETLQRILRN